MMVLETWLGKNKGTAALIQQQYPLAVYTHCAAHVLNLCVVEAMNIVPVRNMLNRNFSILPRVCKAPTAVGANDQ